MDKCKVVSVSVGQVLVISGGIIFATLHIKIMQTLSTYTNHLHLPTKNPPNGGWLTIFVFDFFVIVRFNGV